MKDSKSKALLMKKSDKKVYRKALLKVGKITDGGGRPYSHGEIIKSLKSETKHRKYAHETYEHDH